MIIKIEKKYQWPPDFSISGKHYTPGLGILFFLFTKKCTNFLRRKLKTCPIFHQKKIKIIHVGRQNVVGFFFFFYSNIFLENIGWTLFDFETHLIVFVLIRKSITSPSLLTAMWNYVIIIFVGAAFFVFVYIYIFLRMRIKKVRKLVCEYIYIYIYINLYK